MVMRMKELNKTFVLQHDASDCGVACLLSMHTALLFFHKI